MRLSSKTVLNTLALTTLTFTLAACGTHHHATSHSTSQLSAEELAADVTTHVEVVATPPHILETAKLVGLPPPGPISEDAVRTGKGGDLSKFINFSKIINIGKQVWQVVDKNKPVMNVKYDYATAVPQGVKSAAELSNFSDLQHTSYRIYGKNIYGVTVYDVTYTVIHQFGGSLDQRGHYLATVAVVPSDISVMWGYKVNFSTTDVSTLNVGSTKDPIASLTMELKFEASTFLRKHTKTAIYQFRGDSPFVKAIYQ